MGDWLGMQMASIPALTPWLVLVALIVSSAGFKRLVYFVSIGYAFSIVGMAVVSVVVLRADLTLLTGLQLALLVVWGLRLGIFLVRRETNAAYRRQLVTSGAYDEEKNWLTKLPGWIGVSVLYVAMFSPALFGLASGPASAAWGTWVQGAGLALMAGGLSLEAVADQQKSAAKAKAPGAFMQGGVYAWVRCPNYLGEITFWVGNFIMGIPFYTSALRWVIALHHPDYDGVHETAGAQPGRTLRRAARVSAVRGDGAGVVPIRAGVHVAERARVSGVRAADRSESETRFLCKNRVSFWESRPPGDAFLRPAAGVVIGFAAHAAVGAAGQAGNLALVAPICVHDPQRPCAAAI